MSMDIKWQSPEERQAFDAGVKSAREADEVCRKRTEPVERALAMEGSSISTFERAAMAMAAMKATEITVQTREGELRMVLTLTPKYDLGPPVIKIPPAVAGFAGESLYPFNPCKGG